MRGNSISGTVFIIGMIAVACGEMWIKAKSRKNAWLILSQQYLKCPIYHEIFAALWEAPPHKQQLNALANSIREIRKVIICQENNGTLSIILNTLRTMNMSFANRGIRKTSLERKNGTLLRPAEIGTKYGSKKTKRHGFASSVWIVRLWYAFSRSGFL